MTNLETERLYQLIPAIYRLRDMAEGEPLRALLTVIEREHNVLEKDIDRLYQNWFIETCDEWIVPYIGDLLKVEKLYTNNLQNYGQQEQRAYVANTLAYRRRKGTAYVLEQLTQDITGWRSRAVEFALLVSTTQSLQNLRPMNSTVDLRKNSPLEQIGRPFEQQAAYSVDVRSFRNGGQYNIANIGLFIWRLQSYPIKRVRAFPSNKGRDYYSFSPLGHDLPLFNHPQTELTISTLAQEINIPDILRSPVLNEELDARRKAKFQDESLKIPRYFDSDPVLQIFIDGQPNPIPPEQMLFRSLAHFFQEAESTNLTEAKEDETSNTSNLFWPFLEREKATSPIDSKASETIAFPEKIVEIDPALGRFRFLKNELPSKVELSYHYGFSDDIGGGPYGRDTATHLPVSSTLKDEEIYFAPLIWEIEQDKTADPNPLATAIEEWKKIITVWQGFEQRTHQAIARIKIPSVQIEQVQIDITEQKRSTFAPGIVKGLQVSLSSDSTAIRVSDGLAIDDQGKSLKIRRSYIFKPNPSSIKALPTNNEDNDSRVGILVLFASSTDLPNGNTALLDVVSESTIKGFPRGRLIPLAEVIFKVVSQNNILQSTEFSTTIYPLISLNLEIPRQYQLKFSAGVVHGLEFYNKRGTLEAYITAGTGVDDQGNVVIFTDNIPLNLYPHQDKGKPLSLIIANGNQWKPQLLTEEKLEEFLPPDLYLYLSNFLILDIPKVTILKPDDSNKKDKEKEKHFQFDGFDVKQSVNAKIQIMPGTLTDADGKVLFELCEEQTIDLSYYAGQTIDLFVSSLSLQGFPLPLVEPTQEKGWEYFGLVPQKPNDVAQAHSGLIIIRDNGSYVGDLFIQLPTAQKLKVIAANGDRPHIKGDILIQGLALANEVNQGELVLDGILIEGNIQVLPGNLKQLDIHHCTIASKEESLIDHLSDDSEELIATDDDISIFTFLLYCLGIIWQLNCQELGLISRKSPLTLEQARRLIGGQFQALFEKLEQLFTIYAEGKKVGESQPINSLSMAMHSGKAFHSQRNSRLAIHLCCSILGTIRLSDTVPELMIEDCIITKNIDPNNPITTSAMAIAALGTATAIHRSTIFGRTQVKQLDASDSIFTEKVTVQRHQMGCVRFSYVPPASSTPPRYQCQPDQVLKANLIHLPTPISALAVNQSVNTDKIVSKYTWMMRCIFFNYRKSIVDFFLTFLILKILLKKTWINVNGDLGDRHITAILPKIDLYPNEANPETNGITVTPCILIGTEAGQVLKASRHEIETAIRQLSGADDPTNNAETFYPKLFAGTAGDGLFAYIPQISPTTQFTNKVSTPIRWRSLPLPNSNAPISLIQKESYKIHGTVKVKTDSQSVSNVFGQDTYFSDDLRVGDVITVANQIAKVKQIGRQGQGKITSQGRIVHIQKKQGLNIKEQALNIGDTITIRSETNEQQTRIIEKIVENPSGEIILKINKSFIPDLLNSQSYVINQDTELQIKQIDNNQLIDSQQEESLTVHLLWVGTLGNGLWRGSMDGTTWEMFNHGLPNLAVTALMRDSANHLWLGTKGDGVFLLRKEETKDFQQRNRWVAFNAGLRNGYVTALVEDNQNHLWLGTDDGLFNWKRPNSEQNTVRPKQQDEINDWTEIELTNLTNDFWVTGLAMETAEHGDHLILTTADGKVIFLSTSERETLMQGKELDCPYSLDFRGTDVTTVLIDPKSGDRFIGTAIGEIWQSSYAQDTKDQSSIQKDACFLINEDLPNVARNRELLNQLQPSFTSDQFGNPAYGQMSKTCVSEIRTGAEDGSEMGVFNRLKQPQREDNLRASLNEYLRVGLNAGIFYVT